MVIVIEVMLNKNRQQTLNLTLANGRTMVESRYQNFGLDSEIQS